jgi:6-hydroxy-3-succinoylpyridine 3-monooxygenase
MGPTPRLPKRSIIYIDGFNLYYGALKGGPYKWLNLERYFNLLRPNDCIQKIRYFTALISGSHANNQKVYLQALETLPLVDIIFGKFKVKQIECQVSGCAIPPPRFFQSNEEKRTDVNIALWMLSDAQNNLCEKLILVSGDSDLVPAISMVKNEYSDKEITVYIPARNVTRGAAVELRGAADKNKTLPLQMMHAAQLPAEINNSAGQIIRKPLSW